MLSISALWGDANREPWFIRLMVIHGACLAGLIAVVWWAAGRLPPEYPLFYSFPPGPEQLGRGNAIWQAVGSAGVMGLADMILGWLTINKWRTLAYIILWAGLMNTLIMGYSLMRIYWLVV